MFGRREGERVKDAPVLRQMLPFLMPARNESIVFFEQRLDVTGALAWLDERAAERNPPTFYHVVLLALARTLALRPQLNRFVVGRRLYQRRNIEISFVVKKAFSDSANMTAVKVAFDPHDTLASAGQRIAGQIGVGRGEQRTGTEKEMSIVTRLPRVVLQPAMRMQRVLDYFNLWPASAIESDPMYASIFVANLGSVGLDSAYHHLFEYGTCPLFVTIGKVEGENRLADDGSVEKRKMVSLKYSFDERIADGFYCARSLELVRDFVENPENLEEAPTRS